MSIPRRRIVRPTTNGHSTDRHRHRQLQRLRSRLEHQRAALARWQKRFRRAVNTVQRLQAKVARIEKQLNNLEGRP